MTFANLSRSHLCARWVLIRVLRLLVAVVAVSGNSFAGQVKLAWDPVANATGYRVHYGTSSGGYSSSVDAQAQTAVTVSGLTDGVRYYFAVKAYDSTTTSNFSTEVSTVVQASAPVASFTASPTTGVAPLVVSLSDTSTGTITSRSWNLGDGTTASTQTVAKTYSNPGTYTVTLTVTGSGGSATASKSISVAAPTVSGSGSTTTTGSGSTTTTGSGSTTTTGSGSTTTPIAPHTKNLVAAYGFEEASGGQVVDASGNANYGTISGATRVATNWFGRALKFDGIDDRLTVPNSPSLNISGTGLTLTMWINPQALAGGDSVVLGKFWNATMTSPYYQYGLELTGGTVPTFFFGTTSGVRSASMGSALALNQWSYLAVVFNGSQALFYVNGTLVKAASFPATTITARDTPLRLGADANTQQFFKGYIDEVRVYNRALTQAEIVADSKTAVVGLRLSKSTDRSSAVPLNGLAVSGTIYVYYQLISPTAVSNPVKQVAFWLDNPNPSYPSGAPTRIERISPYDFAGTADSGGAIGFDTTGLSNGIHTITAQVTLSDGTILPFINGTFTVQSSY
jgi:PKD repeat protein